MTSTAKSVAKRRPTLNGRRMLARVLKSTLITMMPITPTDPGAGRTPTI
jgi:hypothetical protein